MKQSLKKMFEVFKEVKKNKKILVNNREGYWESLSTLGKTQNS